MKRIVDRSTCISKLSNLNRGVRWIECPGGGGTHIYHIWPVVVQVCAAVDPHLCPHPHLILVVPVPNTPLFSVLSRTHTHRLIMLILKKE